MFWSPWWLHRRLTGAWTCLTACTEMGPALPLQPPRFPKMSVPHFWPPIGMAPGQHASPQLSLQRSLPSAPPAIARRGGERHRRRRRCPSGRAGGGQAGSTRGGHHPAPQCGCALQPGRFLLVDRAVLRHAARASGADGMAASCPYTDARRSECICVSCPDLATHGWPALRPPPGADLGLMNLEDLFPTFHTRALSEGGASGAGGQVGPPSQACAY